MDILEEKTKKLEEEWNKKFDAEPQNVQKDVVYFQYKGLRARDRMTKKLRYGKPIPDNVLDDIKEHFENFSAAFKLLGIDPNTYNEIDKHER